MATFNLAGGHGAADSGAVNGARKEKNDNLRVSLAMETELVKRGHKVNQYRRDDSVNCSATACREWLAKTKADFSLVFHRNAFKPNQATGVEVWCWDACATISAQLSSAAASALGIADRGRKPNGAAWLNSSVPCCEPELGFIDNESDNKKFDANFNKMINNMCDVLETHYGKGTVADGVIAIGTTTNYLNIRTAPVNGAVLVSMPTGSVCEIYSIENGWAKLSCNGYEGYSSVDYMNIEYIKKEDKPDEIKLSENESEGVNGEVLEKGETTLEKEEALPNATPKEEISEEVGDVGLDKTVPIFIKLLKQIIEIILKLWRKEK